MSEVYKQQWLFTCIDLEKVGWRPQETQADGNCGPRCAAQWVTGSESLHGLIRDKVCKELRANRSKYEAILKLQRSDLTFDQYVDVMSKDGEYFSFLEWIALENFLQVPIKLMVYDMQKGTQYT